VVFLFVETATLEPTLWTAGASTTTTPCVLESLTVVRLSSSSSFVIRFILLRILFAQSRESVLDDENPKPMI
jgi:hypothetical protein